MIAMQFRVLAPMLVGLLLSVAAPGARATTICASTLTQITNAIAAAATDDTGVEIRIVAGTYVLDAAGLDNAAAPAGRALSLQGGFDSDCSTQVPGSSSTQFVAGIGSGLRLSAYGDLVLRDLSFSGLQSHGDLALRGSESDDLIVERVSFRDTVATPILLQMEASESGRISMQNVLVFGTNNANGCVVSVSGSKGRALLANNTIADSNASSGLCLQGSLAKSAYDNIVWGITGTDIANTGAALLSVRNLYGELSGGLLPGSSGDLLADPQFIAPGNSDFSLSPGSPAVNSGGTFLPGGLATLDLAGAARVTGSQVDRGALESANSDLLAFVVSNSGDGSGVNGDPGTLRRAISDANASGLPTLVKFQIPGGCGIHQITIDRALPEIAVPMVIDGSSQPGGTLNTSDTAFNAQICVVIAASTEVASVNQALLILSPDETSVTVRGLGFSGFFAPLIFFTGSGHRVIGNQFGGVLPNGAGLLDLQSNTRSIWFSGGSNSIIGGPDRVDRNMVSGDDGFSSIGIYLGGISNHDIEVRNNLVGMNRSGLLAAPIGRGIVAVNGGHVISGNRVGAANVAGISLSTADHVIVQDNDIGGALPNAVGVVVEAGSNNNTIGAAADETGRGNRVTNNLAGAVWITSNAGISNRVRDNQLLVVESPLDDDAMVLDLGAQGSNPNDPGDGDSGPNNLLNYPVLGGLAISANTIALSASIDAPVGSYILDVYAADRCLSNGRAMASKKLLTTTFSKFQTGVLALPLALANHGDNPGRLGATLTNSGGDTSELSNCIDIDGIFADDFE
jgi:trimeric autotransporter adhesin